MRITLLLLLILPVFSFSQKTYHFDYMLTYETTFFKEDSIKNKTVYLTNSKDNSYFATITIEDNLNCKLIFMQHDKLYANVRVAQTELIQAEFITIACDAIIKSKNNFKNITKHYEYISLKDSLMQNKTYAAYTLKSTYSLKKKLKNHAGSNLYIVDTSYNFHLPILTHPTAYEEWKIHKNLPNGIYIEMKFFNELDEAFSSEKLISISKIDKTIVTDGDCRHLR